MSKLPAFVENHLVGRLQECRRSKSSFQAKLLHNHLLQCKLDTHPIIGNHLVTTLIACGCLPDAQHVFDRLLLPNQYSWSSLISGYSDFGDPQHAFLLYHRFLQESGQSCSHIYVSVLKACTRLQDLCRSHILHTHLVKIGIERDSFVGTGLVDMYGKFVLFSEAQNVLESLSAKDPVLWTALIGAYAEHGLGEEACAFFQSMQHERISPDEGTYVCTVKACGRIGALTFGQEIHTELVKRGLEKGLYIGSTLLDMYCKCGSVAQAEGTLKQLPVRNVVTWTAIITGYVENGLSDNALDCFEQMHIDGVAGDPNVFVCILIACSSLDGCERGLVIHNEIVKRGFEGELTVGHTLVVMYAKFGMLKDSFNVFERLRSSDVVSWNAIITGCVENNFAEEALSFFKRMQSNSVSPVPVTFSCTLKACGILRALETGKELHLEIVKHGWERDRYVGTTLVDMYAKCGALAEATEILVKELPDGNLIAWIALITGYAENGFGNEALNYYKKLQTEGVHGDANMYVCGLKACGVARELEEGQILYINAVKRGLESEPEVGNIVVDMYAKCGSLVEAEYMFDKLKVRNVVAWTALTDGYTENGLGISAVEAIQNMLTDGVLPDSGMFVCSLKASGSAGAGKAGLTLHSLIVKRGLERESYLAHALMYMYSKCNLLAESCKVFKNHLYQTQVSWNTLIMTYTEYELGEEALAFLKQVQFAGGSLDGIALTCSLKACSMLGALEMGQEVHAEALKLGLETDQIVGNTLVDMYGKYGLLAEAQVVFDKLASRDVATWNIMIRGYGENLECQKALQCFDEMIKQGVKPNAITFTSMLAVCSHINFVIKGQEYMKLMVEKHKVKLMQGHLNCMVNLLARSGHVSEAEKFVATTNLSSKAVINCLLMAYRIYSKLEFSMGYSENLL